MKIGAVFLSLKYMAGCDFSYSENITLIKAQDRRALYPKPGLHILIKVVESRHSLDSARLDYKQHVTAI